MKRWEYTWVNGTHTGEMNRVGAAGWRLIPVQFYEGCFLFERELTGDSLDAILDEQDTDKA